MTQNNKSVRLTESGGTVRIRANIPGNWYLNKAGTRFVQDMAKAAKFMPQSAKVVTREALKAAAYQFAVSKGYTVTNFTPKSKPSDRGDE